MTTIHCLPIPMQIKPSCFHHLSPSTWELVLIPSSSSPGLSAPHHTVPHHVSSILYPRYMSNYLLLSPLPWRQCRLLPNWSSFFFFFFFFFFCSGFCHTLKWNSHGFTCVPNPDPPSHLPLHPLPLGFPIAPWSSFFLSGSCLYC